MLLVFLFSLAAHQVFVASQAVSSSDEWGLLSRYGAQASPCGGFSCCGAWLLECMGSVVVVCELSCPVHVGS